MIASARVLLVSKHEATIQSARRAFASHSPHGLEVVGTLAEARGRIGGLLPLLVVVHLGPGDSWRELIQGEQTYPLLILVDPAREEECCPNVLEAGALVECAVLSEEELSRLPRTAGQVLREWSRIVALKKTERALRESRERLRALVDRAPSAMLTTDEEGRIESFNPAAELLFGYSTDEVKGESIGRLIPEPFQGDCHESIQRCLEAGEQHLMGGRREVLALRKDGATVPIQLALGEALLGERRVFTAVLFDLTSQREAEEERVMLEAKFLQSQRMETIGTLAGGIAHDFNNILTPIFGYVHMALEEIPEDSMARPRLQRVQKAANRAKALVHQILTFSRHVGQQRRSVQLHSIVEEAAKLLRASLPSTITIRLDLDAECDPVLADPTQVHQVLMNLSTNAFHAMSAGGGTLEIGLAQVQISREEAEGRPNLAPGGYAKLTFKDTGSGMASETLEKVFVPFFTTKEVGVGTGLGLSVVHGIVLGHHGDIAVSSQPGEGTTFQVYLPLVDGSQERAPEPPPSDPAPSPSGNERILLVDDEREVALLEKVILERLGYRVHLKSSGPEALSLFERDPDRFDLLLTDQTMPGLTGAELASRVTALRPGFPVVLTTGFSEAVTSENYEKYGVTEFIMKPMLPAQLAQVIRRALNRPPNSVLGSA